MPAGNERGNGVRGGRVLPAQSFWKPKSALKIKFTLKAAAEKTDTHLRGTRCAGKSRRREGSGLLPSTGARPPPPAHSHLEFSDLGEGEKRE